MSVCDICCFSDNNRFGYVAIFSDVVNGKHNAVKYYGSEFGTGFRQVTSDFLRNLNVKIVRSAVKFARYIKMLNPMFMVNPVSKNGVVFDIPFIYLGNSYIEWSPLFEDKYTESSFNILSGGLILEYNFKQPIFLSVLNMKRHVAGMNEEKLLINCQNGAITRGICKAEPDRYIEAQYHNVGVTWVCDNYKETPIAGYKLR